MLLLHIVCLEPETRSCICRGLGAGRNGNLVATEVTTVDCMENEGAVWADRKPDEAIYFKYILDVYKSAGDGRNVFKAQGTVAYLPQAMGRPTVLACAVSYI